LEEKIRTLEHKMKGIEKESKQKEKECTLLLARSSSLEENLNERERELKEQTELRLQVFLLSSPLLLVSSYLFILLQGKSTSRRKKQ
jgi:chromosome segregation ATPase